MSRSDRITILLSAVALCVAIVGSSCSTNARIDDLNTGLSARIDDLRDEVAAQIDAVNTRIDDLRDEVATRFSAVNARVDDLHEEVRDLRALVLDAIKAPPAAD